MQPRATGVGRIEGQGAAEQIEGPGMLALVHVYQTQTGQGLVAFLNGGGLAVVGQRSRHVAALHGDGGQAHVGIGLLLAVGGGFGVIVLGFVQLAHEQVASPSSLLIS